MLNENDLQYMRNNREGIKQLRTEPVIITREVQTGKDPYTGEPITVTETETVQAVVTGFTGVVGGEQLLVGGIAIQQGDVAVAFDYGVIMQGIKHIEHDGTLYTLFSVQERGIGTPNRYECVARRVT
jgi:hypothetical protein